MRRIMWAALATFVVVLVLLLLSAGAAHAAIKVTCFDGNAQAVVKVPGQPPQRVDSVCDTVVDGTCQVWGRTSH